MKWIQKSEYFKWVALHLPNSPTGATEVSITCHTEVRKLEYNGLVLPVVALGMETGMQRLTVLPGVPAIRTQK